MSDSPKPRRSGTTTSVVGDTSGTELGAVERFAHAVVRHLRGRDADEAGLAAGRERSLVHALEVLVVGVRDPDVAWALARAYNDWVADFCKAAPQRLFAAAILPLQNIDFAVEELRRIASIPSIRTVFIRSTHSAVAWQSAGHERPARSACPYATGAIGIVVAGVGNIARVGHRRRERSHRRIRCVHDC